MPFLSVMPQPYLKTPPSHDFTLVLDLDETLIHYNETPTGGNFQVRPHAISFLKELGELYEIVVFTAAMADYANWVIDTFDT